MMNKYDLVLLSRVHAEDPYSADLEEQEPIVGTHYVVGLRDEKYDPTDVFTPDGEERHVTSNFCVFGCMCMRDRFIQQALQNFDNPKRKMTKMSTLHRRWDIRGRPLYKEVYNSLVDQMT